MLCAIGDVIEDVVVLLSGPPRLGTDVDARISRHRGGSAANVAVAAAAIDGRARFVGKVGADPLGDRLVDELRRRHVDPAVARGGRTGSIVVLVGPDGERTMLTDRGAAPDLDAWAPGWLDDVTVLHVPAYSLLGGSLARTATDLVAAAHDRGIRVGIDASSSGPLREVGADRFLAQVARLRPDVLLASADEAAVLGVGPHQLPDGVGALVVKHGAQPTVVVTADETTVVPVDGPDGPVVDTTGAGDAFAAAFLLARRDGADAAAAARAGHAIAATTITHAGATGEAER